MSASLNKFISVYGVNKNATLKDIRIHKHFKIVYPGDSEITLNRTKLSDPWTGFQKYYNQFGQIYRTNKDNFIEDGEVLKYVNYALSHPKIAYVLSDRPTMPKQSKTFGRGYKIPDSLPPW